jgi:hypothetical protein
MSFDPSKSLIDKDVLANFVRAPLQDDLTTVPGIGPVTADALRAKGIESSFQLVAKFLSYKTPGICAKELCERFYAFIAEVASRHRNTIVLSVAEKMNVYFPGVYDGEEEK